MENKIVHIIVIEKFIPPFIEFVNQHFDEEDHLYIVLGKRDDRYGKLNADNILFVNKKRKISTLLKYLYSAKKIIIHGLWHEIFIKILFLQPWLLKKSYWVMWGGDFYFPEKHSWYKKQVIKKMGYLVTGTQGDYELAQKWYQASGEHIKCFNYPSNIYKEYSLRDKDNVTINIQVGNSADPTNNHIEVFEKLKKYKDKDIMIFVPLSYGDEKYADEVTKKGYTIFGDKFKPMMNFLPFDKYLEFLADVDIAIFNHERQQAFGNIITLLGLGKKVYIHKSSTLNGVFNEYSITVYDTNILNINLIDKSIKEKNTNSVKYNFSKQSLINSLHCWIT